jgi:hypothetical protein
MVYNCTCDDLKFTTDAVWSTSNLASARKRDDFDTQSPDSVRPSEYHDCIIMRTCRQVHAGFAIALYRRPLQIKCATDRYTLPLSRSYAHLVHRILFFEVGLSTLRKGIVQRTIRRSLEICASRLDMFPNIHRIRLVVSPREENGPGFPWGILTSHARNTPRRGPKSGGRHQSVSSQCNE